MKKKKAGRVLLSFLLTLAMVVGLMPGMGLTVRADDDGLFVVPDGSGSITVDGNYYTAVSNPGWKFDYWHYVVNEETSEGDSTDNPWQFTGYEMDFLYAYFVAVDVAGVGLNKSSTTLTVIDTETLIATVEPNDAIRTVTWSSDNTAVATVDANGKVTAVAAGTATITVTATNGTDDTSDDKTATCVVTITENNGDTQQNPDGTKTVTKENADGKTIVITNYSKTDEQISQFVFEKAKGTKLDLINVNSKTLKTVVIPESVKANGNTYKVTRIRKGFLKNCKQATKVDIGKNINTIDKNAFNYGKKVQKVVIRGKLKKVGKNAFKNTKKNVVIKVKTSTKNFKKNKTLLEKSGLPKNATVKRVKNKK